MNLSIPDSILSADISTTDKLVYGVHLSNQRMSKTEIARLLKLNRSTVHRAILNAQKCCTHATECCTSATECCTHATLSEEKPKSVAPMQQSVAPMQHETNKQVYKKEKGGVGPSWKEVERFSFQMKRPDLAEEFFEHYEGCGWEHDGRPLGNWRAMFRGWCRRTPSPDDAPPRQTTPNGYQRPLTLEEARFIQDQSY